jgi:hypothetical protein
VPLVDYKQEFVCTYADGCHNSPHSSFDTYHYFMNNFNHLVSSNRAPMGIHLRKEWFSHPFYYPNIRGLEMFLDSVLSFRQDVYAVSITQMLDWLRAPVSLADTASFEAWKC